MTTPDNCVSPSLDITTELDSEIQHIRSRDKLNGHFPLGVNFGVQSSEIIPKWSGIFLDSFDT